MTVEVYDWDASSSDDFLGQTTVKLSDIMDHQDVNYDKWISLNNVPKGEIHLICDWRPARPMTNSSDNIRRAVLSVFVDR